ncbi:MAG: LysR family transcriptional regulator [Lachnospiraceae bacterium]|nr:LysR family transcriptional regulator [Lachnospiraceae bacterium]
MVRPKVKVQLVADAPFFGPGVCELMERIEETGSLQKACLAMNLSYSKGSRMIYGLDRQYGYPMVERRVGGSDGGGSTLTEEGRHLVETYKQMIAEVESETERLYKKYFEEEDFVS